jgi:hypothetical protein
MCGVVRARADFNWCGGMCTGHSTVRVIRLCGTCISTEQFGLARQQFKDSIRPIIVVKVLKSDDRLRLELKNDGAGPALGITGEFTNTTNILGEKSSCVVTILESAGMHESEEPQLFIRYSSLDRRHCETVVDLHPSK